MKKKKKYNLPLFLRLREIEDSLETLGATFIYINGKCARFPKAPRIISACVCYIRRRWTQTDKKGRHTCVHNTHIYRNFYCFWVLSRVQRQGRSSRNDSFHGVNRMTAGMAVYVSTPACYYYLSDTRMAGVGNDVTHLDPFEFHCNSQFSLRRKSFIFYKFFSRCEEVKQECSLTIFPHAKPCKNTIFPHADLTWGIWHFAHT